MGGYAWHARHEASISWWLCSFSLATPHCSLPPQLQYRDQRLLEAIAQQAQRKAAILTPQDISQLASAYARLSYQQPQLLQLLQVQAEVKANDFKPWALVHTAWALHVCGQNVLQLLTVAVPLLRDPEQLKQLNALDMSSLLWLLAGETGKMGGCVGLQPSRHLE